MICDEAEVQTLKDVKVVAHLWYVKKRISHTMFHVLRVSS